MKKKNKFTYPPAMPQTMTLKETALALEETELVVNVRAAKDGLSGLLEQAAQGNEVIITSDGMPKARLVPVRARRQPFRVDWGLLRGMPMTTGPAVEELVRTDRDGRN